MRKFFAKKSSKDSDANLHPPSSTKKPRDRALRHSRSLPQLGWNYNEAVANNTYGAVLPRDPFRPIISQPLGRIPHYDEQTKKAMEPEAIASHKKPVFPLSKKHQRKGTVDKADITIAKHSNLVINIGNQADHISVTAQRGAPPQPPAKEVRDLENRRLEAERRYHEEEQARRNMLGQFPVPPVQGLPERPPCNLPATSPPVHRGGKLVEELLFRRRPEQRGPPPQSPLPDIPASAPRPSQFPVLGSRDGVPTNDLLPSPKPHEFRERFRKARQAKENDPSRAAAQPQYGSAFTAVHNTSSSVDLPQTAVTPRNWASPAVLHDTPKTRIGHHRLVSNPDPPSQYHREWNRTHEGDSLREKEGPRAHQVKVTSPPRHKPAQSVDTQANWDRANDVHPNYQSTAPLNVRAKESRTKQAAPAHLDNGYGRDQREHHRLDSAGQQMTHVRGDLWTFDIPNARLKAGGDVGDRNIGLPMKDTPKKHIGMPMKLQPHSRNGSSSSSSTLVGSSSGHGHGYSSSSDSTHHQKEKSYPPVVRTEHRGIVRSKLQYHEESPANAELGYYKPTGLSASMGHATREPRYHDRF